MNLSGAPPDGANPREPGSPYVRWTFVFAGGLLLLLAARIAALQINGTDLFFDEAQYWSWSQEPAFGYYSKPPLIAWLIRAATDVCGMGEACIRLPSPLIHTATAIVIFLLGRRLYGARPDARVGARGGTRNPVVRHKLLRGARVGVLSGLAFATLPAVSLSAGIISTDVPLLFAWALALLALAALFDTRAWWPALLLGIALGLGLNAKYAMAWFAMCLAVYLVLTPARHTILKDPRLYAAFAIGLALIAPNLYWNAAHGFATFAHTADNAKWDGVPFHPGKALEFFAAQFGVFGPVLFATLLVIAWRAWKRRLPEPDRFLLAFSLPLLLVITVQAFLSRAHANWAAVAYVATSVLVTASLIRGRSEIGSLGRWGKRWLALSFALHLAIAALVPLGTSLAGRVAPPGGIPDPFKRTMGWAALAATTREQLDEGRARRRPFAAVLARDRKMTAELLYYMRGETTPVVTWVEGERPADHYEMTRPFTAATGEPVLFVAFKDESAKAAPIARMFGKADISAMRDIPAGAKDSRTVVFYALSGYRGR